ncbi:hypothetical protein LA080_006338 [Diaporthe eres]|uniref:Uncharacterized protein n=1 Tax=Diaporthe vaccinii TaxID=105482 RepID=A0ABR4FE37_9PEZI|nr:hypothetical protein LA080_006338 [Diaporthe eres]
MAGKSDNGDNGSAPAPTKAAAGGGFSTLTTREQEILAKAMTCLKTAPEIDFPKLATELDMKNPRSAVNAWSQIKKKMDWTLKGPASPAVGKAPAAGKRKMADVDEEEVDDDDEIAAPTKRAKIAPKSRKKLPTAPKKGKAGAAVKDDSEEDQVSSEVKAGVKEEQVDGEV